MTAGVRTVLRRVVSVVEVLLDPLDWLVDTAVQVRRHRRAQRVRGRVHLDADGRVIRTTWTDETTS